MGYYPGGGPRLKLEGRERVPVTFGGSFQDALKQAKDEFKFLVVYLHSGYHDDTPRFLRESLCTELVASILDEDFLFWGGDVRSAEGMRSTYELGVTAFPFLGIICSINTTGMMQDSLKQLGYGVPKSGRILLTSWSTMEDPALSSSSALAAALGTFIESHSPLLVAAKAERTQVTTNRSIIEEQNQAYLESLRQDEEKSRQRNQEHEEKSRLDRESREKKQKEEEEKEAVRKEAERLKHEAELRRETLAAHVDEEPPTSDATTQLMIRFSDGGKLKRRFLKSDKLANLFVFIASKEPQHKYSVVTHFPRATLTDGTLTFDEAKLTPQATIFVEEDL
jgi:FAS-associated factor 2